VLLDPCSDPPGRRFVEHLGPPRSGVDVAMPAGLVASASYVDLEGRQPIPSQDEVMLCEFSLEAVHAPGHRIMAARTNATRR